MGSGKWSAASRSGLLLTAWVGESRLAVAMLVLLSAGSLVLGLGTDFWEMTVGRSMIGFAAAAWVLLIVLYTSEVEPARLLQSTAQMTIVFAAGRVTASLICPWLVSMFGQSMPFWLSSGVALLAAVILLFTPLKVLPRVNSIISIN